VPQFLTGHLPDPKIVATSFAFPSSLPSLEHWTEKQGRPAGDEDRRRDRGEDKATSARLRGVRRRKTVEAKPARATAQGKRDDHHAREHKQAAAMTDRGEVKAADSGGSWRWVRSKMKLRVSCSTASGCH